MKKLLVCLIIPCLAVISVHAQTSPDSLAYQLQRKKINSMLDVRRQQFGQYDESLSQHTGIFGLQTKKDIRRSNEILMDIVKTDDEIFRQTKILLDYRVFEQTKVQDRAKDMETSNLGYMNTINKLRNELDRVKKEAADKEKSQENLKMLMFLIVGLTILVSILIVVSKRRALKRKFGVE